MANLITAEQLLEVFRATMDPGYVIPLEDEADGRGFDLYQAAAALLARVSEAVDVTTQALYLKSHSIQTQPPASGGVKAVVNIEVQRDLTVDAGPISLAAGDEVALRQLTPDGTEILSPVYALAGAVAVAGPGPFVVAATAVREGFLGNVRSGQAGVFVRRGTAIVDIDTITPGTSTITITLGTNNRFVASMVGQFVRVSSGANIDQPPARITAIVSETELTAEISSWAAQSGGLADVLDAADLGLSVEFKDMVTLGRSAELDLLARERNQGRTAEEGDESLRSRVCGLADTISPNALIRGISAVLTPLGVDFTFLELGVDIPGFAFDFDAFDEPNGYAEGRIFIGGEGVALATIGFLVVVDGTQLPAPTEAAIGALHRTLMDIKGGAAPFMIAFEPPIP